MGIANPQVLRQASNGASPFLTLNEGTNHKVLPCVFGG